MVQFCAAYGCNSRFSKGCRLSFHRFPKNPDLRRKWGLATNRKDFTPNDTTVLCSKHFQQSDYETGGLVKKLKPDSVPSVFEFPPNFHQRKLKQILFQTQVPGKTTNIKAEIKNEIGLQDENSTPTLGADAMNERNCTKDGPAACSSTSESTVKKENENVVWSLVESASSESVKEEPAENVVWSLTESTSSESVKEEFAEDSTVNYGLSEEVALESWRPVEEEEEEEDSLPEPLDLVCVNMEQLSDYETEDTQDCHRGSGEEDDELPVEYRQENLSEMYTRSDHSDTKTIVNTTCDPTKSFDQGENSVKYQGTGNLGIKSYTCYICRKSYNKKKVLVRHLKGVHLEEKSYVCDVCNKSFMEKNKMVKHKNSVHIGIKTYSCDICFKSFSYKHVMVKHKSTVHLGVKTHTCDVCNKSFGNKNHMKMHKNSVHLGIKGHTCDVCSKSFSNKFHMEMHRNSVHFGVKSFTCGECNKLYCDKSSLSKHLKKVHLKSCQQT